MASLERPCLHLRKSLADPPPGAIWPRGIHVSSLAGPQDAIDAHNLLADAYRHRGGSIDAFGPWLAALTADAEYDPTLFFLARHGDAIVGVAHCWTSAFVKDLAVAAPWRRQGVATALLLHLFGHFRMRGVPHVDLKVELDNPSGAQQLYRRLSMKPVDRP